MPSTEPTLREALRFLVRLLHLVRPYWRGFARGVWLGMLVAVTGMATPYLSKLFIDQVYPSRDMTLMPLLVIAVLTVTFASSAMDAVRGYYSILVAARLSSATGLLFFNHLQHLPARFFDEHQVGELVSRFGDVRAALGAVSNVFQTLLSSAIYLLVVPPVLFLLNWKLALISLITVPITSLISTASGRIVRKHWKLSMESMAELGGLQVEVLTHIRTLKAMAAEHHVYSTALTQAHAALTSQLKASGIGAVVNLCNAGVRTIGTAVYTWYAWTLILRGDLTIGGFVAFSAYVGFLVGPVNQVAGLFSSFQQTAVSLSRMFEYLDQSPEQDPTLAYTAAPALIRARGDMRVERVSFRYRAESRVLHDVSLALAPGSVTAVVGPSGAGKSSLLRLLCRMAEPEHGVIMLDGVPISQIPMRDLRRQISVVWQDVALFRGTIWDNLTLGLTAPSRNIVDEAMHTCGLDGVITELPAGYDTPVAEWGASLSGGQRQRLGIARALLRDTSVLLLDEATSQIDAQTEAEVLNELLFAQARADRTVVFVTHRVATAAMAHQVCVIDGGAVVGVGSHRELTNTCETYRSLLRAAGAPDVRPLKVLGV